MQPSAPKPPMPAEAMDVREVPCTTKHPLILRTWHELPVGGSFIVRNQHAPERIRQQIEEIYPGALRWEVLTAAPEDVSVQLTKLNASGPAVPLVGSGCDH
jgi:uncharacterized protein (DUF2249 family)